ncbi:per os infectivity factor 3 [Spodoptera frugiperda multiple nucleopolyhedrovirus]|uniref:Per os infection factor 3 protein n=1 Tax=Spodoptera frugiperda nuclear polyhedrosis virus TaxID=10455 RepID=A1YJ39_NPVSF|nr:per os infectivity factor 3 [Spodoptera frugiperda multiple nucleopolyhedrovirus]ABM45759.1 per os infectivity factor 3 [Spodoptera frugiperda multiple nucleopolyhedrovirus]ADV91281.1 pif-3 [Spodoptera frugiperda multiple nucleopolyhedrovirus]AFH59000.1 pif-3 [Spodoptera frugiperda multiple nucleopolyhedrovirus]AIW01460.1 per os infection factor 3 protein [Spodoptera frugiperda multiple nucleopolyhedrovirus]QED39962.1 PIF-3 [Spodoptera frugiperda multiple nucleopolyhedrovirus]
MPSSSIYGIVVALVVLFIVCFYIMGTIQTLNDRETHEIVKANVNPQTAMDIVFDRNGVVDCNSTRLPCISDQQCQDNCLIQTAIGGIACNNGFCGTRDASFTGRPDDFECDPKLGLIKAYVASEFVVDQMCISTYRDIVDDLGEPRPYLCDNGVLDIDLISKQFSAADCTCSSGYTKMLFNQTALARSIPVCIPNRSRNVFSKIYEVLQ